jgi:hypothetical protein
MDTAISGELPSKIYWGKELPEISPCYIVEVNIGDYRNLYLIYGIYTECLEWIKNEWGYPDPEDMHTSVGSKQQRI